MATISGNNGFDSNRHRNNMGRVSVEAWSSAHIALNASTICDTVVGRWGRLSKRCFIVRQRVSIGLRSGLEAGHSRRVMAKLSSTSRVCFARWAGAPSCTIGPRALDFRTVKWCKNWFSNVLDVGFRCDFSPRLFPNNQWAKPVSNNCSPNHYMRELLELRNQTVLMILFSWVTGNPHIATETSNIASSLISPNNPHPILHRPMFMILGPSKATFFILLTEA